MTLIALAILGLMAVQLLPVSLMPDIPIPNITVQVSAPGYSARALDATIMSPLRNQLMQVGDLKEIRVESRDDGGNIFMEFNYGSDIDFLFIEVNEKIDRGMTYLPRELERPRIIKASATDIPSFYLNLSLKDSGADDSQFLELSLLTSQVIAKRIEQIPEVAMVDISGLSYPEILIVPDESKLESLGIGFNDIENALQANNIHLGNLTIRDGQYLYNIRFENSLTGKSDIENLFLKIHGRLYQLKELAEVIEQPQKRQNIIRSDGQYALTLAVIKQSDARMKSLKEEISALLRNMSDEYPEVSFSLTRDQTELLEYSIDNLKSNIITAAILACLIIFFFMGNFRSPLLIVISIPISLILSFLFFHLLGLSINIISLSGLILGLGMMVDNSIIVIDNISQYWQRGLTIKDAIIKGTNEVFAPMLSSVLTTCSVFVPLIFLSGITGALFYDQAMAVMVGLFASLIVAVTVIPVYYLLFYQNNDRLPTNKYLQKIDVSAPMTRMYEKGLKQVFRHRKLAWVIFLASIPLTVLVYSAVEKEKLPPITHNDILLYVDWNDRITVEENDRRVTALLGEIETSPTQSTAMSGVQQFLLSHTQNLTTSESIVYIQGEDGDAIARIESQIASYFVRNYPEANHSIKASGNIFDIIFSDAEPPLVAHLKSRNGEVPDPDLLNRLLGKISADIPEIHFEPVLWNEYLLLTPKPELLTLYNVSYESLFAVLQNKLNQHTLFTLNNGIASTPVMGGQNREVKDILEGSIKNRDSSDIPLYSLLSETRSRDLKNVISGAGGNYYPLAVNALPEDIPVLMERIQHIVQENGGFDVEFKGSYFSNRSMVRELILVLIVALLLLYFILAAQFESIIQPVIILSEVLIDICGALLILFIFGASINLMSLIGIVVMCGIVVNDSILKVDSINKLQKEGYSLLRAVMTAGVRRLKPIVMTSLTTILAVVPFLYRGNMGADLQYPLSLTIIGGMIIGALVSIFFIPLMYYQIYRKRT